MNGDASQFYFLYIVVAIIAAALTAERLEEKRESRMPQARSCKWGYFIGCMGVAAVPPCILMLFLVFGPSGSQSIGALLFLFFAAHVMCGWFIIRRNRAAWVIGTLLSLNPVLFFINGVYLWNRRAELEAEANAVPQEKRLSKSVFVRLCLCVVGAGIGGYGLVFEGSGVNWSVLGSGLLAGLVVSFSILFLGWWFCALLWAWLLRRIAEVSRAMRGES